MRILIISQQYPPATSLGGIGAQAVAKAHGLAALGHDVHVLSRASDRCPAGPTLDGAARVTRIATGSDGLTQEAGRWLADAVAVAAAAEGLAEEVGGFDVIEAPEYAAEALGVLAERADWRHTPVAVHVHGPIGMLSQHLGWPEPGSTLATVGAAIERAALRLADLVYASSGFSARWVAADAGLDLATIPVWHCGVDTTEFRPPASRPSGEGPLTVMFVGRVASSKGVEQLLASLATVSRDADVRVRLVGPVDAAAQRLVARFADALDIHVTGPVARDELPGHLADADVFAAPSRFEAGPGLVYLEAMACGLPVVATDVGGVGENIHDGDNGVLVPPDDTVALEQALATLMRDRDLRLAMGDRARDWVVANADTRSSLPKLAALLGRAAR